MPLRTAIATAAVRPLAPSFSMMCFTWTLTVSSEMNRRSAISRFRLPAATLLKHVDLTRGQRFVGDVLGQLGRDLLWDPLLARVHLPNDLDEVLRRHVLQHIPAGACRKRALNLDVAFKRRQHHDAGVWKLVSNGDQGVDPAHVRHAQIHERDVWPMVAEQGNRFAAR